MASTDHIPDETIEAAIKSNDDPDHPDALTVDEVRDLLAWVQRGAEVGWGTYMDHVESGDVEVVAEDRDTIVLSTGAHNSVAEELDRYEGEVEVDDIAKSIVTQVHHEVANDRCDRNWSADYPYVVCKPDGFDAGQRYVEAVVNGLVARGLTASEAWAYYGVAIRGESQSAWGRRLDRDQSQISKALKSARSKLP